MRRATVTLILAALGVGLAFFLFTRERSAVPEATADVATTSEGAGAGTAMAPTTPDGSAKVAAGDAGATAEAAPAAATVSLGRPLRVVAHGWDLIVPGLVAKGKGEFSKRGLDVEFRAVSRLEDIESALAAGGASDKGADVAIVALPLLALTYEDLSALRPELFWVVGFSRGRDAVYASKAGKAGEATLTSLAKGKVKLVGDKERASTFLALYALDASGVSIPKVKLMSPEDPKRAGATFAAVDRSLASAERLKSGRRLLLSTADAASLVPYVAIAPHGFLDQNSDVATAFGAAWLAGVEELRRDVPAAARTVAALEGTPAPVVLIKRLGQIEFVDLSGNAKLLALSGRGAVSAHALFRTSFRIWREAGVISTAAPEVTPIAPGAVSTLVFARGAPPAQNPKAAVADDAKPILISRSAKVDEDGAIAKIATLADLFPRSVIEVGFAGSGKATKMAIDRTAERFGIAATRLVAAPKRSKRGQLTLAVMPIP